MRVQLRFSEGTVTVAATSTVKVKVQLQLKQAKVRVTARVRVTTRVSDRALPHLPGPIGRSNAGMGVAVDYPHHSHCDGIPARGRGLVLAEESDVV